MDINESRWREIVLNPPAKRTLERAALNLAEQNADDTSVTDGFAFHSAAWFQMFCWTYDGNLDEGLDDDTIEKWGF